MHIEEYVERLTSNASSTGPSQRPIIPGLEQSHHTNRGNTTAGKGCGKHVGRIVNVKHSLVNQIFECILDGVVYPGVDLRPHTFNAVVLEKKG